MPTGGRVDLAHSYYAAYEAADRSAVEALLADDFTFSSPADVGIDRATYFERCWPNSEQIHGYEFVRLFEVGEEVVVTYESVKRDGSRFRNTEVLRFAGDRIREVEVYFGWSL